MTGRKANKPHASGEVWIKLSLPEFKAGWLQIPHHGTREYQIHVVVSLLKRWRTNWRPEFEEARPALVPRKSEPPMWAEFLLTMLLKPSHVEAVTGDLNERFTDECEKFGRLRAVRLYWARTLRSLWPMLVRAIGKALKWGAVIAAVRRMF